MAHLEGEDLAAFIQRRRREDSRRGAFLVAALLVFGAGWWFGAGSVDAPAPQQTSRTGLTVGDMLQVCSVLRDYGSGGLDGCDAAAHSAANRWGGAPEAVVDPDLLR